ncbi:hypothetical protein DPMN_121839 [Dreissena polymorpha]|uniref:Uncharacterized protein n=1 Tax=Dreissena polymorpha TaxID=45954 RepID=A0A9D4GRE6_DREPO|nr:hypothetical protein DPMN_121839 [Dreissena polymorpha]
MSLSMLSSQHAVRTSDNDGSFVSKGISGGSSGSSLEQSPSGTSRKGSLCTLRKCCSMSSVYVNIYNLQL